MTQRSALPSVVHQVEKVIVEDRLSLEQIKAVTTEATTQSYDHPFRPTFWDRHVCGDGVVLIQNAGSIADRNVGSFARIGEDRAPCDCARARGQQASNGRIIER